MEAITRLTLSRLGTQTAYLAISQIDPMNLALLAFRIKGVAIGRIEQDIKAVAAGKRGPIAVTNTFLTLHSARSNPVLVVLKAARNSEIRFRVVERDPIIFSRRNLVQMIPVFAAGEALIDAAVRSEQQTLANWWFRGLVFVFRFRRLRRRRCASLNRECVTIRMNFLT